MGKKGAVVSKQQLSDEFLNGFRACEEMPKVEETAVCSETDVDAFWQVLFCLTEHDAEEDGEHCWGQNASLLDAVGDHCKLTQTEVVRTCRLAKTILQGTVKGGRRQGRQEKRWGDNQGIDRPGVRHVPEGCGEERKMEETGCEIICSEPTTLAVKE